MKIDKIIRNIERILDFHKEAKCDNEQRLRDLQQIDLSKAFEPEKLRGEYHHIHGSLCALTSIIIDLEALLAVCTEEE